MELTHAGIDVDQSSLRPPTYTAYVLWHHVRSGQTLSQQSSFILSSTQTVLNKPTSRC